MNTTIGRPAAKAVRGNGDVAANARPVAVKERLVIMQGNMEQGDGRRKRLHRLVTVISCLATLGGLHMPSKIEAKLAELGLALPPAPQPFASFQHVVIVGELAFVAGQPPLIGAERPFTGALHENAEGLEKGRKAAKLSLLNVLAQLKAALGGDLDRVVRCVKLGVFVNSAPDFRSQPVVANGASDLMVGLMGDDGRHVRFSVGTIGPMDFTCSVEAIFQIKP